MFSPSASSPAESISNEARVALLQHARDAVLAKLSGGSRPSIPDSLRAALPPCGGVFVSLYRNNRLRGCVGRIGALPDLAAAVCECAIGSALEDPRFTPMTLAESDGLRVEISVLSPARAVKPDEVIPGLHGLCIECGWHRGVLLPQVAARYNWTRERFLEETCVKAGLPPNAWQDPSTRIEVFTAEVFAEEL